MSKQLRRIGYLRISPTDQNPGVQADVLKQAGCDYIYQLTISENPPAGEALKELLNLLGDSDTLLVYRLDRLDRDEHSVMNFQQQLEAMGVTDDQETMRGSDEQ